MPLYRYLVKSNVNRPMISSLLIIRGLDDYNKDYSQHKVCWQSLSRKQRGGMVFDTILERNNHDCNQIGQKTIECSKSGTQI